MSSNVEVRSFWEQEPCGTSREIVGHAEFHTRDWFEQVERYRYDVEPFIHSVAQFTRHHGKTILEVGVGAGTDHLQWARAGCRCHGVDLTAAAIEATRDRLALYGFTSELHCLDAEALPFDDEHFDVVYSWGVIHHTARPDRLVHEIHRVLKPHGLFIGMMYGRHSLTALRIWARHAVLKCRPWRSISEIIATQVESAGTKAYTVAELQQLFAAFSMFTAKPVLALSDRSGWPTWISRFFPDEWGWFVTLAGQK
jgi:ubiquinone/menaquinone biosynthesis C-methylase UbiE